MAEQAHELAPHHLPIFVPSADGSDPLMTIMLAALLLGVVLLGTFYLHLHSLPERLAHKHGRMQFELVAVLGLLALFTHNNIFWVAALLLAFIQLPDFATPIGTIANALNRIANRYDGTERQDKVEQEIEIDVEATQEGMSTEASIVAEAVPEAQAPSGANTLEPEKKDG
ncbi:hypothetical protein [Roseibium sp. SCP14]|uniref:hypothetical protein n=1 Tax=Roseibium sp. SCP14 TaxID=3141375 RepID=UPI00333B014C